MERDRTSRSPSRSQRSHPNPTVERADDPRTGIGVVDRLSLPVLTQFARSGASDEALYSTRLVLEELLVNVVRHSGATEVRVRAQWRTNGGWLQIEDDGKPFDPTESTRPSTADGGALPSVGGRGIELVRRSARHLSYERLGNVNRVVVIV